MLATFITKFLIPPSSGRQALMMEAASTSKTLVNFFQNTRHNNQEDCHLQGYFYLRNMSVSCPLGRVQCFVNRAEFWTRLSISSLFQTSKFCGVAFVESSVLESEVN
jgi:hypothetical protein